MNVHEETKLSLGKAEESLPSIPSNVSLDEATQGSVGKLQSEQAWSFLGGHSESSPSVTQVHADSLASPAATLPQLLPRSEQSWMVPVQRPSSLPQVPGAQTQAQAVIESPSSEPQEESSFPWPWVTQEETPLWEKHWPLPGWERYENRGFLASGGMGRVFQAWDPRLQRLVAIKFLKGDDPDLAQRFIHEAQIQAKVEHDNICKVYEVGYEKGKPFIVMQFIQGDHLGHAAKEMNREQVAAVLAQAAEGVHAAHRQGLIHRDLKPSNIMTARLPDGGWHPYVMDFGLAREASAQGQTQVGTVLGTPAYMAPEQAKGEVHLLDRRTDIYSLGATLYALLLGHPPFTSESAYEVIRQVIDEDPPAPRSLDATIPPDLEAIALKAMAKDPAKRYDSARAMAEDLRRYLEGEPVLARQVDWSYLLARRIHKHRYVVAASAVGILALLGALGSFLYSRWTTTRRTALAQEFALKAEELAGTMRYEAVLPLHDSSESRSQVQTQMKRLEGQMQLLGSVAQGPGHDALGRASLALDRTEEAFDHLSKAIQLQYLNPRTRFAFAVAASELYQQGLRELKKLQDPQAKLHKRKELEARYREPARRQLQGLEALGQESPDYLAALLAFIEGDTTQALHHAQRARSTQPMHSAHLSLLSDIFLARCEEALDRAALGEAEAELVQAEQALQKALEIGRSDAPLYARMGNLYRVRLTFSTWGPRPADRDTFQKALHYLDLSQKIAPDSLRSLFLRIQTCQNWLFVQGLQGKKDPVITQQVLELSQKRVELQTHSARAFWALGDAWRNCAHHLPLSTEKKLEALDQGLAAFQRALDLDPKDVNILNNTGTLLLDKGFTLSEAGLDARSTLREGILPLMRILPLAPQYFNAYINLGEIHWYLALQEAEWGGKPEENLKKCQEFQHQAISLAPEDFYPYAFLAYAQSMLVQTSHELASGEAWARKSMALSPDAPHGYAALGLVELAKARILNTWKPLQDAKAAFLKSLKLNPHHPEALWGLTRTAEQAVQMGQHPETWIRPALEALAKDAQGQRSFQTELRSLRLKQLSRNPHEKAQAASQWQALQQSAPGHPALQKR